MGHSTKFATVPPEVLAKDGFANPKVKLQNCSLISIVMAS